MPRTLGIRIGRALFVDDSAAVEALDPGEAGQGALLPKWAADGFAAVEAAGFREGGSDLMPKSVDELAALENISGLPCLAGYEVICAIATFATFNQ